MTSVIFLSILQQTIPFVPPASDYCRENYISRFECEIVMDAASRLSGGRKDILESYTPIVIYMNETRCVHFHIDRGSLDGRSPTYCYDLSGALIEEYRGDTVIPGLK